MIRKLLTLGLLAAAACSGPSLADESKVLDFTPEEMKRIPQHVAQLVRKDAELACHYTRTFGVPPAAVKEDEALLVDVGKALAAFQETIVAARTAFDEFRDALARGDRATAARYSLPAQRGL